MSSLSKRDAEQAFGKDLAGVEERKRKKRSRSSRPKSGSSAVRERGLNGVDAAVKDPEQTLVSLETPQALTLGKNSTASVVESTNVKPDSAATASPKDKKSKRKRKSRGRTEIHKEPRDSAAALSVNTELQPVEPGPGLAQLIQGDSKFLERLQDPSEREIKVSKAEKKRQRKSEQKQQEIQEDQHKAVAKIEDDHDMTQQKPPGSKKQKKSKKKSKTTREHSLNRWDLSAPAGGVFADSDPILTTDGEYVIAGMGQSVNVYALGTSLLVRSVNCTRRSKITSCVQSQIQQQHVYVGLDDGHVLKVDWTISGEPLWTTTFDEPIFSIVETSTTLEQDVIVVAHGHNAAERDLTRVAVDKHKQQTRTSILQDRQNTHQLWSSSKEGILLVAGSKVILIGQTKNNNDYTWQELGVPGSISCFGAHLSKHGNSRSALNLAVGLDSGQIHVYHDILITKAQNLVPRKLHWHRSGPEAVRFAPDGNYLISGGNETTLVVWQLDTNQQQYLPHLSTSILNIAVSAQGDRYALRMADNSVMVLSTSDLKPLANMSGLSIDSITKQDWTSGARIASQVHPHHPERLLLACSVQALNSKLRPSEKIATSLQTYDTSAQLQLYRQALVQTTTTKINVGPHQKTISEPDVTHLDITHDGKWLITADRWQPEVDGGKGIYLEDVDVLGKATQTEVHLRFWGLSSTSEDGEVVADAWEEGTRINRPVTELSPIATQRGILAIAVNPVKYQVAVADTNRHLKIYTPKARIRNGVQVKNKAGEVLYTWTCDHEIPFEEAAEGNASKTAAVAFSEDGSVIATSWSSVNPKRARVFLLNSKTGETAASFADIVSVNQSQLAFRGRYVIALSEKFCVFDTVTSQVVFELELDAQYEHSKSLLALDHSTGVVAVAVSPRAAGRPSKLVLLRVGDAIERLLDTTASGQIVVLKATKYNGEFLIIDSEARTSRIVPPTSSAFVVSTAAATMDSQIAKTGLSSIFGETALASSTVPPPQNLLEGQGQQRRLEDILSFESTARAPMARELFDQVVRVIAGVGA